MFGGTNLNLASALIKQIIETQDFETWAAIRQDYLPSEYHKLFSIIDNHCSEYHELPSFEDLKFEIRDITTKEKLYAIESVEVEVDAYQLLQYLKNEYAQKEILTELEDYVDNSVAFESAEESLDHLYQIVVDVEGRIDLEDAQETMQRINLFESEEEYGKYLALGINEEFDQLHQFGPRDLILAGGYRGSGKSVTCANIAINMYDRGKSSVTYSTEMDKRSVLRRMCSIATGVDQTRLKMRNLSVTEWELVAAWWAGRFCDSDTVLKQYMSHRNFDKFHSKLTSSCELLPTCQLDVVYDPMLTIAKINSDLDKKMKSGLDIGIIIVDYLNKVKLNATPSKRGAFDWVEQLEVSTALKAVAATYERPVFAPYQTKEDGTTSFSKGIMIDADAAYVLKAEKGDNPCIKFECTKMRDGEERDFTSVMDWSSLKMGPESAMHTEDMPDVDDLKTGEEVDDAPF
jgi:replicative DNA helicase